MPSTLRILCPVDLSPGSAEALKLALSLARGQKAEVHVLYSYSVPHTIQPNLLVWMATGPRPVIDLAEEQATRDLDEFIANSNALTQGVKQHVVHGDATSKILEFAQENAVGLIVMGTHGRTGVARVVLGSVTETVVRRAPCPVLTVRESYAQNLEEEGDRSAQPAAGSGEPRVQH